MLGNTLGDVDRGKIGGTKDYVRFYQVDPLRVIGLVTLKVQGLDRVILLVIHE